MGVSKRGCPLLYSWWRSKKMGDVVCLYPIILSNRKLLSYNWLRGYFVPITELTILLSNIFNHILITLIICVLH